MSEEFEDARDIDTSFSKSVLVLTAIAVGLCVFLQVLDYSIANVAIPYISGGLAVSYTQGTWVITSFSVGNAISLPLTGWLTKRYRKVPVMVGSVALFTVFSFLCGISFTFPMIVLSRFFQGFVAGPLTALSQTLLMLIFPKEKKNVALVMWSMIALIGPILGPIVGGWLTFDFSWPWIFYVNIPIGIFCVIVISKVLWKREKQMVIKDPVDWKGFFFLALGVGFLQVLLDKGQQYDWFRSPWIRLFAVISVVSLIYLVIWELKEKHPIIDIKLFRNIKFTVGTLATAIAYGCFFGVIVLTPLWLQNYQGYTPIWAGFALAPIGILPLILSPITAYLMKKKVSLKALIVFSFVSFGAALFWFAYCNTQVSFEYVAVTRLVFGIGIATFIPGLIAFSMEEITPCKLTSASGIFHFMRIFCGGAGTSLFSALWERRATHHHSNLVDSATQLNSNFASFDSKLENLGMPSQVALETYDTLVEKQAFMLSLNDVYWVEAWIFVGLILAILFFKSRKPKACGSS